MSRSSPVDLTTEKCNHSSISCEPSTYALGAGYRWPTPQQRQAATTPHGKIRKGAESLNELFPAPLILPDDDLAADPNDPPQSFRSWLGGKHRNEVTAERRTIYVAAPPSTGSNVSFMKSWTEPEIPKESVLKPPNIADVLDYLSAFYHGLPVKKLPPPKLSFSKWDGEDTTKRKRTRSDTTDISFVGLNTSSNCIRIRARPSKDGLFSRQLNLEDLLDAAIEMLPGDAYALLLLVNHDMYEDEDDDFACGRAYGGCRVAVISTARYHPGLDYTQNVDREHSWPVSHCTEYMRQCCASVSVSKTSKSKKTNSGPGSVPAKIHEPLRAAVNAYNSLSTTSLSGLWLTRVCRTSSHELGHCFGIAHCVYYACSMQGTSSLMEDTRQPLYLCPVDLAKVLAATGVTARKRYTALLDFCRKEKHKDTQLFVAYRAWIRKRLEELDEKEE